MALRLSRLFGNSAEFWLNAQRAVDLWDTAQAITAAVESSSPIASFLPAEIGGPHGCSHRRLGRIGKRVRHAR
jgi:hypothetical protein